MTCEDAPALISAKLDGELSPEETEALNAHLEACPACRQWMEAMAAVDRRVAALEEPAPEGLKKGVLYRIDQATGKAKKPGRRWFGPGTALGAVAAVLVLLVGLGVIPFGNKASARPMEEQQAPETVGRNDAVVFPAETIGGQYYYAPASELPFPEAEAPVQEDRPVQPTEPAEFPDSASPDWNRGEPISSEGAPGPSKPAADSAQLRCAALSENENAMVLLYTDFDAESVFGLLKTEEPALYALTEAMRSVEENGLQRYETDCGTALAIQEWLLAELPPAQTVSAEAISAERRVKVRMEALDPGSSSLRRVIRFSQAAREIDWPELWPADWADRLRAGESWELYFPDADYTPNSGKKAILVFSGGAE